MDREICMNGRKVSERLALRSARQDDLNYAFAPAVQLKGERRQRTATTCVSSAVAGLKVTSALPNARIRRAQDEKNPMTPAAQSVRRRGGRPSCLRASASTASSSSISPVRRWYSEAIRIIAPSSSGAQRGFGNDGGGGAGCELHPRDRSASRSKVGRAREAIEAGAPPRRTRGAFSRAARSRNPRRRRRTRWGCPEARC